VRGQVTGQPPEQTGPEEQARQYLAYGRGLPAATGCQAEQRRDDDDQRDVANDLDRYGIHRSALR
jgi:hypothetical protein